MSEPKATVRTSEYIRKRKKLSGFLFETALPNEYLVEVGKHKIKPVLGGKKLRLFKKFLRVPAFVQTLYFSTDNANVNFQGIGIDGYATWRIDPSRPEVAITALDFFDEDDPMARTNDELKTICIEAVRHVISNMDIANALRKKDDIAANLKDQLKDVEAKWGIVFHQVGIEKVRIMSKTVFENLQAQYRDTLRLDVAKTRISTDKQIAAEENIQKEKTELESLETMRKIELSRIDNQALVNEQELTKKQELALKQRAMQEEDFLAEARFILEKQQKNYELKVQEKELEIKLQAIEHDLLAVSAGVQDLRNTMAEKQLEVERLKRQVEQTYSHEELSKQFMEKLPKLFEAIKVDNYSVLASGKEGDISPVSRLFQELAFILKTSGLDWFKKGENK